MIIDETFMWLYAAYKFGMMCVASMVGAGFASLIAIAMYCEPLGDSERIARMTWKISAYVIPISLCLVAITPTENELKAYAAYTIGKEAVNSDEARELFNHALKYIDCQTQK